MSWSVPLGFTYLEENLARCTGPLTKANVLYCVSIHIERIFNFTQPIQDPSILSIFDEHGIRIQDVNLEKEEISPANIVKFQEWIGSSVDDVISQCSHAFTLIVGSPEHYLDCLVIGCFRKVQEWAIVPIIAELRMFTFPHKLYDYEQMIELFDSSLVDIATLAPEWYIVHANIKAEEIKLKEKCKEHRKNRKVDEENEEEGEEQRRIDEILFKLCFNESNELITDQVTFNPAISLVADKDDDD